MTAPRDYRDFLNDMIIACRAIIAFVEGLTFENYMTDEKTQFAVMHGFERMGEAVRHIPNSVKSANPEIPWSTMAKLRNRVIHGYFGVDESILFSAIHDDLKPLLPRLEQLAKEHGAEG
jgi:uncharacterized protein with HEPN domain